jgi:hypothetical protein
VGGACQQCPAGRYGALPGLTSPNCTGACVPSPGAVCLAGETAPQGRVHAVFLTSASGCVGPAVIRSDSLSHLWLFDEDLPISEWLYPPGADCITVIEAPSEGGVVALSFSSLHLDAGDEVSVYDGSIVSQPALLFRAMMYDRATGVVVVSSTGGLTVRFASNPNPASVDGWFTAAVSTLCQPGRWSRDGRWLASVGCAQCTAAPGHSCWRAGSLAPAGMPCPAGRYGPDGDSCLLCPAGRFGHGTGESNAMCSGVCEATSAFRHCPAGATSPDGDERSAVYLMDRCALRCFTLVWDGVCVRGGAYALPLLSALGNGRTRSLFCRPSFVSFIRVSTYPSTAGAPCRRFVEPVKGGRVWRGGGLVALFRDRDRQQASTHTLPRTRRSCPGPTSVPAASTPRLVVTRSTSYLPDMDCSVTLTPPDAGTAVGVRYTEYSVGPGDRVDVYDGTTQDVRVPVSFDDVMNPTRLVVGTLGPLTVRFTSGSNDGSLEKGFTLLVELVCAAGRWSDSGHPPCAPCAAPAGAGCAVASTSPLGATCGRGRYSPGGAGAVCLPCPAGRFGNTTSMTAASCSGPCVARPGHACGPAAVAAGGTPIVFYVVDSCPGPMVVSAADYGALAVAPGFAYSFDSGEAEDCSVVVTTSAGGDPSALLALRFLEFSLEISDLVEVRDSSNAAAPMIGPSPVRSYGNVELRGAHVVASGGNLTVRLRVGGGSGEAGGFFATLACLCAPGTWSIDGLGLVSACSPCAAAPGYGCWQVGSASPSGSPCPAGRYGPGGAVPCVRCPSGRYGDATGSSNATCSGICRASAGHTCGLGESLAGGSPVVFYFGDACGPVGSTDSPPVVVTLGVNQPFAQVALQRPSEPPLERGRVCSLTIVAPTGVPALSFSEFSLMGGKLFAGNDNAGHFHLGSLKNQVLPGDSGGAHCSLGPFYVVCGCDVHARVFADLCSYVPAC